MGFKRSRSGVTFTGVESDLHSEVYTNVGMHSYVHSDEQANGVPAAVLVQVSDTDVGACLAGAQSPASA